MPKMKSDQTLLKIFEEKEKSFSNANLYEQLTFEEKDKIFNLIKNRNAFLIDNEKRTSKNKIMEGIEKNSVLYKTLMFIRKQRGGIRFR